MPTEIRESIWLSRSETVSLAELAALAGLNETDVRELVDSGALAPVDPRDAAWTFSADCVMTVRQASRLRRDLELDAHALALTLRLLGRIRVLEDELAKLRARQSLSGSE